MDSLAQEYQRNRKSWLPLVVTALVILATLLVLRICKKPPRTPVAAARAKKPEDSRPRISLAGQLLFSTPAAPAQAAALDTLAALGKDFRVHVVCQVSSDEEETAMRRQLEALVAEHRVLFCTTEIGYKSLIRQLNPRLHLDLSLAQAREMRAYTQSICLVGSQPSEFQSIPEFVGCAEWIRRLLDERVL